MNVERNPGREFTKVICGRFNQGNNPKFRNMALYSYSATTE